MTFVVATFEFPGSNREGNIYIKGDLLKNDTCLIFKKGVIFNYDTDNDILSSISIDGIAIIPRLVGEFTLVWYDYNLDVLFIANDKLGRETIFYFYDNIRFIISDNFWEIINIIAPDESDIDVQSVKEFVIFNRPLFYKTIIQDMYFYPPAHIAEYHVSERKYKMLDYWDFRYQPNLSMTLFEAAEHIDHLLDASLKRIKEIYPSNTIYGLGLSGGLDSRLIAHYGRKNNMKLISFIIGERKPHKLFLSRDHSNARKLANIYNIQHIEIEYNCIDFYDKLYYEIKYVPMNNARLFQTISESELPYFDVLLTGMNGGEIFGSAIPSNIQSLNAEQLIEIMLIKFSNVYTTSYIDKIYILLKYIMTICLGIGSYNKEKKSNMNILIDEEALNEAKSKLAYFVRSERDNGKTNIDIFQKYLFFLIQNNKYGSFGMFWKQANHSIFSDSCFIEESFKWKPEFLFDRKLQQEFFKRLPDLSKIPSQNYSPAIIYKGNKLKSIMSLAEFILRGNGVVRYGTWSKQNEYINFAKTILSSKNNMFNMCFNITDVSKCNIPENLIKIKMVLDCIERKSYGQFI